MNAVKSVIYLFLFYGTHDEMDCECHNGYADEDRQYTKKKDQVGGAASSAMGNNMEKPPLKILWVID